MIYQYQSQSEISLGDLRSIGGKIRTLAYLPEPEDKNSGVMRGQFSYHNHCGGLSLHGGSVTELQNLKNCFELPPGISFNLVFNGYVDFVLAGKKYRLTDSPDVDCMCTSIVAAKPEVVTRYLKKGMSVCKLNLFVERAWLEQRCSSPSDRVTLNRVFANHAKVDHWEPSSEIIQIAKRILAEDQLSDSLAGSLRNEALVIELLAMCLDELKGHSDQHTLTYSSENAAFDEQHKLRESIEENLHRCHSLDSLAEALNMSVSTLQRRFKAAFGMTVIDYVRQRRLEIAKCALIEDRISVGQAAFMAGYKYPSNFVNAFKKNFSMTPSEFKKSHC